MAKEEISPLKTELNWDSGLTWVVCTLCNARNLCGETFVHNESCPELQLGSSKKRKITEITKTITYRVPCVIEDDGSITVP